MGQMIKAACWAAALLVLGAANAAGLVGDDSAGTLFIILPIVAWLSIFGAKACLPKAGRTAQ